MDVDACARRDLLPLAVAEGAVLGGVAALQLRAKDLGTRPLLALAQSMATLCAQHATPFFVNDRLDLALAVGAGLHVGQGDLPLGTVRAIAPTIAVGVSTHTREELEEALRAGPTYVAFGPVFPTSSKERAEPVVGLEALSTMAALSRGLPLVAIGGIGLAQAGSVVSAGATHVAAISGLLPSRGEARDRASTISAVSALAHAYDRAARPS